jgi:4-aminobutyrate aminotransferase-like enzyme
MLPPLNITAAEIDEATTILDGALAAVSVEEVKA